MKRHILTLDECLDIPDWFNDPEYDYLMHIYISKTDGERRLSNVLPELRRRARRYLRRNRGFENAYPEAQLNGAA